MGMKQMADPEESGASAGSVRDYNKCGDGGGSEGASEGEGGGSEGGGDLASVAVPAIPFIRPMLSPMGLAIFRHLGDQAQTWLTNATVLMMS